ncbi:DUF2238 domain-containing protein [Chitinophagaceae bacterium MMS25-I14]
MKNASQSAAMLTASLPAQSLKASSVLFAGLCIAFGAFWVSCFAGTTDLINWYIENILVLLFVVMLGLTYRRYRFSNLSYICFFVFLCLHVYGAKYAYADNPFGYWLQSHWHLKRNPYDRIVHASFGLLIVYPIRELITRTAAVKAVLIWLLPVEMILSLAGLFELVEWSVADVFCPAHGKNYVGTQGDIWDAQKDMVVALGGAIFMTCIIYAVKSIYRKINA